MFLYTQRLPDSFKWRNLEGLFSPTLHGLSLHTRFHLERSHLRSRLGPLRSNKDKTGSRCPFCYISWKGGGPGDLRLSEAPTFNTWPFMFRRLADELAGWNGSCTQFCSTEEPLDGPLSFPLLVLGNRARKSKKTPIQLLPGSI